MTYRYTPAVPAVPAPRSIARRLQRPGRIGRVLMIATMLGVTVALSTVGVIARIDQKETTQRLVIKREQNLQAIGISVAPVESSRALERGTTIASAGEVASMQSAVPR